MSNSEYSSDEEDEDYVPGVESASDDEGLEDIDEDGEVKVKTKEKKKTVTKKKRKGGIQLEDEVDDDNDDDEVDLDATTAEELAKKKKEKEEAEKKTRVEDLWASFKKETEAVRPKSTVASSGSKLTKSTEKLQRQSPSVAASTKPAAQSTSAQKVTITKTYDFAGEAVTVTKTVDAESSEAKQQYKSEKEVTTPAGLAGLSAPAPAKKSDPSSMGGLLSGAKRKGGLGSVLGQIGKKPKISTLEKSKLDWETFKAEEGIEDDLKNYNKDGYLEKQDFLQRTDVRLFEREKAARQGSRKL
ncbi:craniofacial development protein 1 [Nematostella vectensis]|uniref:craniofacial development protein 1 n=1 Tax=Nematostella vectensis TaxID=45351 RepID=UPI002076E3A4|nr:craniofacial development protein 1 [Nematostella vectensis]